MGLGSLSAVKSEAKHGRGNGNLLQKNLCQHTVSPRTAAVSAPGHTASHWISMTSPEISKHSQASMAQSLVGLLLLSLGSWSTQGFVCSLQESVFPVLCKFWRLYGGVNGDLLQECLCHTQVCCTQSPCLCGRLLLTHTSTGNAQTQFWLSVCGISGSWCAQGLFEPSGRLWGL